MFEIVWINWHHATVVKKKPSSLNCAHCLSATCKGWQEYIMIKADDG